MFTITMDATRWAVQSTDDSAALITRQLPSDDVVRRCTVDVALRASCLWSVSIGKPGRR
jgi:hypothetical protein